MMMNLPENIEKSSVVYYFYQKRERGDEHAYRIFNVGDGDISPGYRRIEKDIFPLSDLVKKHGPHRIKKRSKRDFVFLDKNFEGLITCGIESRGIYFIALTHGFRNGNAGIEIDFVFAFVPKMVF